MPRKPYQLLGRPLAAALGVIVLANLLFFVLTAVAPGDPDGVADRVRSAFRTGQLGFVDYLPFDSRRGWHQYNDCNVLQMLSNPDSSRLKRALAPIIYKAGKDFNEACPVLHALVVSDVDRETLLSFRYARYWHGYNVLTAFDLRAMEIKDFRRVLSVAVWVAILILALATYWSGPHARRTGLIIAFTAATVWAVPYFAPSVTHGPGDALLLLALAGIAARPRMANDLRAIVPYATGFGAAVVFFEMLTGQLPIAAAWLMALTFAAERDEGQPERVGTPVVAFAAITAFWLGAAATVIVKQMASFMLAEPAAGTQFLIQLRQYMSVPESKGGWPGIMLPFARLLRASNTLTFGNRLAGYGLVAATALTWLAVMMDGWRRRQSGYGQDVLILLAVALIPIAWVMLLPRHTYIHAPFMVRILVVPISLTPLALCWPPVWASKSPAELAGI